VVEQTLGIGSSCIGQAHEGVQRQERCDSLSRWRSVVCVQELARVTMEARHPGKSDGILRKGPEVKYAFIQHHKADLADPGAVPSSG